MSQVAVSTFNFNGHALNCVLDEAGNPLFRADDLCEILEFANSRDALANHVDPEDVAKRDTLTAGGVQSVNHVNESGMYSLIFGSRKESAKIFKRWVTSEVLPAIRKTGSYVAPNAPAPAVASPPLAYLEQSVELLQQSSEVNFNEMRSVRRELDEFYDSLPQKMENIFNAASGKYAAEMKGVEMLLEAADRRVQALERLVSRLEKRLDRLEDRAAA